MPDDSVSLSGERFTVDYRFPGPEAHARVCAELVCIDQTVEAPRELIAPGLIRDHVLGRVEDFRPVRDGGYEASISFPTELLNGEGAQLLNVLFGMSSLRRGVRQVRLNFPESVLRRWPGPRFGRAGLRRLVNVMDRPLVCGVLKPLGLPVQALADLARQFALGGLDLIKDDQGLMDQPFCRFEERVIRCAEAVLDANRETGRSCLYFPHVSGRWDTVQQRSVLAKQSGAGGLLLCPGLTGFDALGDLARADAIGLPILSHPACLGTYIVHAESGIAPAVIFGQLPRLFGADAVLYPSFDSGYAMDAEDCRQILHATDEPWGELKPIFPTAAGRVGIERVESLCRFYGKDVLFILGSSIQRDPNGLLHACRRFVEEIRRCSG